MICTSPCCFLSLSCAGYTIFSFLILDFMDISFIYRYVREVAARGGGGILGIYLNFASFILILILNSFSFSSRSSLGVSSWSCSSSTPKCLPLLLLTKFCLISSTSETIDQKFTDEDPGCVVDCGFSRRGRGSRGP